MVKYELKKIFSNKFVVAAIIVGVVVTAVYAAYRSTVYKSGTDCAFENVILQSGVLSETTVTKDNIEALERRVAEIEADESNYAFVNASERNDKYFGKFTEQNEKRIAEIYSSTDDRELTAEEQSEAERIESYQISDEVFPEYYALCYMVQSYRRLEYQTTLDYFRGLGIFVDSTEQLPPAEKKELQRDLVRLENGVVYDRNFGWQELLKAGASSALPVLISVLTALSSVISVTAEYETGMYSLIISSARGGKSILLKKIISSALFSVIATLIYETAALASFGAFFSLRGAYSDSGMVLFGSVKSMLECFLLMILLTLFSSLAVSLTSLAVSAFCKKTFAAAGANLVMLLIPLVFGHFYYVMPNVNLAGVVSSLPINIPLADYGLSTYREIIINDAIVGAYNVLLPFIPVCAVLTAVSVPLIKFGWKRRRTEK